MGPGAFNFFLCFLLVKSLCGLEASQVPAEEALSGVGEPCDVMDSSDEMDAQEESTQERSVSRKKKSKRHKGMGLAFLRTRALSMVIDAVLSN